MVQVFSWRRNFGSACRCAHYLYLAGLVESDEKIRIRKLQRTFYLPLMWRVEVVKR